MLWVFYALFSNKPFPTKERVDEEIKGWLITALIYGVALGITLLYINANNY